MAPLHAPARRAALAVSSVVAGIGPRRRAHGRGLGPRYLYVGGGGARTPAPAPPRSPSARSPRRRRSRSPGRPCSCRPARTPTRCSPGTPGRPAPPSPSSRPPGATVTVSGAKHGFTISTQSWITSRASRSRRRQRLLRLQHHWNPPVGDTADSGQRVSGATAYGMYLNSMTNSVVTGNLVTDNSASGIYLTNGSTGNQVTGNEELAATRTATSATPTGSTCAPRAISSAATGSHDNEDSGIQCYPGGDRNTIVDNVSYHNKGFTTVKLSNCNPPSTGNTAGCITGDHGIDDYAVTGSTIIGNTVYDNVRPASTSRACRPAHRAASPSRTTSPSTTPRLPERRRRHGQVPCARRGTSASTPPRSSARASTTTSSTSA